MNLARFDLVTLGLFVAIARAGSISAGARENNIAIGAASKRISDLEAALQVPLLTRYAFGVELTAAGHICLQHAQHLIDEVGRMNAAIIDLSKGIRGVVRLATCPSALVQFLSHDMRPFFERYPGIRVEFSECSSASVIRLLQENRVDIGLCLPHGALPEGLAVRSYRTDRLHLIMRQGHPLAEFPESSFRAALDYSFAGIDIETNLSQLLQRQATILDIQMNVHHRVASFHSLYEVVQLTNSLAIVPNGVASQLDPAYGIRSIPLSDEWAKRRFIIALRESNKSHPLIQPLLDTLDAT